MQPPRVEELCDNPEFQEANGNLKETAAEGEKFGRSGQRETFMQTDTQPPVSLEAQIPSELKSQAVSPTVSKGSSELAETLGNTPAKDKNFKWSGQRDLKRKKLNNKKLGQDKKDNAPQENQKEVGLFSLLKCFAKEILEKLLSEDKRACKIPTIWKERLKKIH
ncbi:hypothetical protein IHO40_00335 [Wolbachia endosymbiont of Mansonella ozzardi]|uniref:hypothetical protein n=1 Tax=Wolbachia endosymbiont of Mansonella ozzardi TaxID=137464 RepID=UPI001CE05F21|nr:hypothetical protein [Wolbachia endosymbiont of Mansonella ozzardi]MCA4774637.1 hypothetical protein [Wolbachia endosymbiont of Mansonella ozzardi]